MNKKKTKAAILAVAMLQMVYLGISPALADIAKAFPDTPISTIQTIVTFPSIVTIFITLLSGKLASIIPKRHLANAGILLLIITGIAGFLFHGSVAILYVWAGLVGAAMGLFVPSITAMIAAYFEGDERSAVLGQQSTFVNGGGILILFFGGLLATITWNFNYLIYTILGIPILIIGLIGFPKHESTSVQEKQKIRLGTAPFYYAVIAMFYNVVFNVLPTNASLLIDEEATGNAATAGTASAIMMLGGCIAGFIFGKLSPKLKDYMISCAFVIVSVGFLIVYFASNVPVLLIGSFISGTGISFLLPQVLYGTSVSVDPASSAMAVSLVMALSGLGSFLSPKIITPLAAVINESTKTRFLITAIIGLCLAIIFAVTTTVIQKKNAAKSSA